MKVERRFTEHFKAGKPLTLKDDHRAVVNATTIFPSTVVDPDDHVLKSGINQRKIGNRIVKGKWYGFPIYTLTLEERATCPRSCEHWADCYGNHMHRAKRYRHGVALEDKIEHQLIQLSDDHPRGFVVRLHILGDFYSLGYVVRWMAWLHRFPQMRVFGYTARWINDPIGAALMTLRSAEPDRWWVRFSGRDKETPISTGESGIICPVQTNQTDCCGTCGLCWAANKPIRFLVH